MNAVVIAGVTILLCECYSHARANVRFGSKTDIPLMSGMGRKARKSGEQAELFAGPELYSQEGQPGADDNGSAARSQEDRKGSHRNQT